MGSISSTIKLVDNMSSTLNKISGNVEALKKKLGGIGDEQSTFDNFSFKTFIANAKAAGEEISTIGRNMSIALTLPLIKLGQSSYDSYKEHESAMTGVKKTVNATEEEYAQLEADLYEISQTTPTGFTDAAGVMEMAGQMGIATDRLTDFTKAYIDLQESTDIQGSEGAESLAKFMTVTGEDFDNTAKLGGVIVGLGNNFATTEGEILAMATRMGATADLAGFSATEILAFSTALSSVGINAEAGGSAAGKLMKKMQLAAEVGGSVQEKLSAGGWEFDSGLEFVNYLESLSKADLVGMADQMGVTTDALKDMANNWLLLDQFSEVMGITGDEFLSGWDDSPAQSMLNFFQGLGNLDSEAGNSVLAQLAEMDITEIRLSNLVAAMAGNSQVFQDALTEAYKQYGLDTTNNAMAEEVAKRYATTESQDQMLMNQWENTLAQFGDNVANAIEPAKEAVQGLLDAFNGLSEVDQQKIVNVLAAVAIGGPTLVLLGKTVSLISTLAEKLAKIAKLGGVSGALNGTASTASTASTTASTASTGLMSGLWGKAISVASKASPYLALAAISKTVFDIVDATGTERDWGEFNRNVEQIESLTQDTGIDGVTRFQEALTDVTEAIMAPVPSGDDAVDPVKEAFSKYANLMLALDPGNSLWATIDEFADLSDGLNESEISNVLENSGISGDAWVELSKNFVNKVAEMLSTPEGTAELGEIASTVQSTAESAVSAADGIMNTTSGAEIGTNFDAGIASAITSHASSVISAAVSMVTAAIAAANAAAGIKSPSKETYWSGEMLIAGYTKAISKGQSAVSKAMRTTISEAWDDIGYFAGVEQGQLIDEDSEITVSASDIEKIRSLAEREAINEFTSAQVTVEFGGITNNVSQDVDLDRMLSYIEDQVTERLEAAAEGVYT